MTDTPAGEMWFLDSERLIAYMGPRADKATVAPRKTKQTVLTTAFAMASNDPSNYAAAIALLQARGIPLTTVCRIHSATLMHYAVLRDHVDGIRAMAAAGFPVDFDTAAVCSPLAAAANLASAPAIKALLGVGADPNQNDRAGVPVLLKALQRNAPVRAIRALVKAGANLAEARDAQGRGALHYLPADARPALAAMVRSAVWAD